ncbi:MAG: ankyrin repeat domain-containing protein [Spirochaetaceae bacterium]|jgi:ankyrin repeat protein|nr:ankyrin repeat domain-containing protein [Spirochaetaceae bacterium]
MQSIGKKYAGAARKRVPVLTGMLSFGIFCFVFLFVPVFESYAFGKKQAQSSAASAEETAPGYEAEVETDLTPIDRIAALVNGGNVEGAKTAFVSMNDPDAVDSRGRNVVHFAAEAGNSELADFFVRLGTDADTKDGGGLTPLNISSEQLDSATASVLVKNGAFIHHGVEGTQSPAVRAIEAKDDAFLRALLTPETMLSTDDEGRTVLHLATGAGEPAAITNILNSGDDITRSELINKRDKTGRTALDYAFLHRDSRSHATAAEILIQAGGFSSDPFFLYFAPVVRSQNFNQRAADGNSALHYAVKERYRGFTLFLLDHMADPNIKNTTGDTGLHEAARIGDVEVIRALLDRGANVNIQDGQGNTAMHIAIPVEVHRAALELLLSYRANPNLRDERGDSPAHIVISLNRPPDILETLLKNGADVTIHNSEGKTPLFLAVEQNRTALLPLLVRYGSDIFAVTNEGSTPFGLALNGPKETLNQLITGETVTQSDTNGNTALIVAVQSDAEPEIIQRILDRNALINARNQEGDTALHIAVRQNLAAAGELLIARGADVFAQNAKGESPVYLTFYSPGDIRDWMLTPTVLTARDGLGNTLLHYATQWKLNSAIPLIASRGASLEAANVTGETPLFIAVKIDSSPTVQALLSAGASIAGRDTLGNTALHTAVRWNALSAAQTLISSKIDINAFNLYGKTPLHDAVRLGVFGMESLLVESGAYLESRDKEGNTPLTEAMLKGSFRSAEHLANSGANVSTRNNNGDTPLMIAVEAERSDLVGLLLDKQAQIHAKDADGETPFTVALKISPRMMLTLLAKGRDQTDDAGRTPLHIALSYNMPETDIETIANWLGNTGAVDSEGRTALRYAVDRANWDAAKFLANGGADVFSVARDGKTPADITLTTENREAVRAVFGGKAIGSRDSEGNNILHYAGRDSPASIVSLLIELGADKAARNTAGDTPYDMARRWNRQDIMVILR